MNSDIRCERCGEKLRSKNVKWLELSETDGNYYVDRLPIGHKSQGSFPFGTTCATVQIKETIHKIKSPL